MIISVHNVISYLANIYELIFRKLEGDDLYGK